MTDFMVHNITLLVGNDSLVYEVSVRSKNLQRSLLACQAVYIF